MKSRRIRAERRRGPRIMERFNGLPFKVNGHGSDGFDCMGLIHAYLTEMDVEGVPDEFQGITLDNYTDFYLQDRKAAYQVLLDLFDTLADPVDVTAILAGDICVVQRDDGALFPAIYAGNGNVLAALAGVGVKVIALKNMSILKARRP